MATPEKQYDEISAEDFESWVGNKVTQLVLQKLTEKREMIANFILSGGCRESEGTQSSYDFHAGQVRGLNELFYLFEEVKSEAAEERREMNYDH